MPAFTVQVKLDQVVTKEIALLVEAADEDEARALTLGALETYPAPMPYNPMIHKIVTTKVQHWIPKSIDFVDVKKGDHEVN